MTLPPPPASVDTLAIAPIRWHKSAPRQVRRAKSAEEGWRGWQDHLASRRKPAPWRERYAGARSPLLWGFPLNGSGDETASLLERLYELRSPRAAACEEAAQELKFWLDECEPARGLLGDQRLRFAYEAVAWAAALPELAGACDQALWQRALALLLAASQPEASPQACDEPLAEWMLATELPLTLAALLPEIEDCRRLAKAGAEALTDGLFRYLDADGQPPPREFGRLRAWLGCATRAWRLLPLRRGATLPAGAGGRFRKLLRQTLRFTRPDGRQFLVPGAVGAAAPELFVEAVKLAGGGRERRIAAVALPEGKNRRPSANDLRGLKSPAHHAEASGAAVLRSDWTRQGNTLALTYHGDTIQAELACGQEALFSGLWSLEVRADGRPVPRVGVWEEVCWESDDDMDYLELEIALADGVRVQRQLLLARQDQFLLAADAVLGSTECVWEHRAHWRLGQGCLWTPEAETRESWLRGGKSRARLVPLAQPEWRAERCAGGVALVEDGLEFTQQGRGAALFAPWFLDLSGKRAKQELTWRRLSVADQLVNLPADQAAAYRVQVGKRNWFVYRSLTPPPPSRTALGQNLNTQYIVARFLPDGTLQRLIDIE